ncbi:hypothetical protein JHK82_016248 [Glycine max]|nr:hypothetical protein JHK87_016185 [Glycine soja]KAG5149367.1 hypothetical protein JHK82_016248 [Glycine max]
MLQLSCSAGTLFTQRINELNFSELVSSGINVVSKLIRNLQYGPPLRNFSQLPLITLVGSLDQDRR